jgi:toxin ParE1/3/4
MKYRYLLSKLALRDLEDIWNYTLNNWSLNQADFCYKLIIKEIEILCSDPYQSKSLELVKKGYRAKLVKSHMIIFKVEKSTIYINRILHHKMDIELLLAE